MSVEVAAALALQVRPSGVGILTLDVPGRSVNTLHRDLADEFAAALDRVENTGDLEALIIISGKAEGFIAGADLHPLENMREPSEGTSLSRLMQTLTHRLAGLGVVTIAAIHGECLGGGLELALACDARVASDDDTTRLAVPEVQLGLLPGGGGTQRLPRLVGLVAALDMMLTGRRLRATRCRSLGLVDAVVPVRELEAEAVNLAMRLARMSPGTRRRALNRPMDRLLTPAALFNRAALALAPLRRAVLSRARTRVIDETRGRYPAPLRILEVVDTGLDRGMRAGLEAEAMAFGELCVSPQSRALVSLFFATTALKKEFTVGPGESGVPPIRSVVVVGAGLMGTGIGQISALQAEADVRLADRDRAAAEAGLGRVVDALDERVARGRLSSGQRDACVARLHATGPDELLGDVDLVIEAVFEELDLKRKILARAEQEAPRAIFASNTSALSIAALARDSARPSRVLGMHYFSPVERMPLLEVVRTPDTEEDALVACVDLGRRQGKTVVVVNDAPGFYTTRILAPYMNEAARLVSEGVAVATVDEALLDFGFPVGPLALLDDVGIDVGAKVARSLDEVFGERMRPPEVLSGLETDGRLGRKNGRGFYVYDEGGKGPRVGVDPGIYPVLGVTPGAGEVSDGLASRCVLLMLNEAARCLDDGVLRRARDGDVAAVFGLGFPAFLGGPFRHVDRLGAVAVVAELDALVVAHGARFEPSPLLRRLAANGASFHATGSPGAGV